jgi:2-keto-3-deoxy-L-rhamnonate aldolase RhmA
VAQYRALGYDYVAVASDLGLFMRSAQTTLSAIRGAAPPPPRPSQGY